MDLGWYQAQELIPTKPAMIIFSNNGAPQTDNLTFINAGYYTKKGYFATVGATGIRTMEADSQELVNVYTLDGRLVRTAKNGGDALNGLAKGVYIINKKKFVLK